MNLLANHSCDAGLPPVEHTIEAGGMHWRYLVWGDQGVPFVLWHGISSSADGWWRVGPALAKQGFQVFAPDLPGHGGSQSSPDGYAASATARLLDAWLTAIGVRDPILLGHSWGGLNALTHALLPDANVRARALILEDPAIAIATDYEAILPSFLAGVGDEPSDEVIHAFVAADPRIDRCDAVFKAQALYSVQRSAVEGFFRENAGIRLIERLADLSVPTLLPLGDADFGGLFPASYVERMAAGAPNVEIEVVPRSSHSLHRDSFNGFMTALNRFMQRHKLVPTD